MRLGRQARSSPPPIRPAPTSFDEPNHSSLRCCIIASKPRRMISTQHPPRPCVRFSPPPSSPPPATSPPRPPPAPPQADPRHARSHDDETIVVTGIRRDADDALGGVSVVEGAELANAIRPSIGETLAKQPGVTATSFGPAASRPILRGLGGDRIRILTDGIGSLDLSSSSVDHAVAINPLTADRIEILRGPSALLFGSAAIGGVVNVIDSRIPRRYPERPAHVEGQLGYGTAAQRTLGQPRPRRPARLGVRRPWRRQLVEQRRPAHRRLHPVASRCATKPAPAPTRRSPRSPTSRATCPTAPPSRRELAAALGYVKGALNVGVSVTRHTAFYGVPIRYSLDPDARGRSPAPRRRADPLRRARRNPARRRVRHAPRPRRDRALSP